MEKSVVKSKLKQIVAEMLGVDDEVMKDDANLVEDLNADSLDVVEIIMEIEDSFEIVLSDDEAENLKTLNEITDLIVEKLTQ